MARKGENIYARKDGRWEGRYIIERLASGKYRYGYVYAGTYRETRERLLQKKLDLIHCKKEQVSPSASEPVALEQLAVDWLAKQKSQIKESSYVKYQNLIAKYLIPQIGELQPQELTSERLEIFCKTLLSSGGRHHSGLSAKTVSDILSVTRAILRYSASKGYVISCDFSVISFKQPSKNLRILSRLEQQKLCSYLQNNLTPVHLGILLSLFSGLRIGEICALRWSDISFEEKLIFVRRTMQRLQNTQDSERKTRICISTPKSPSSIRQIPIPDGLLELLRNNSGNKNGYILTGKADTFMEPRTMQRRFKKVLKAAGIEEVNYHILRHTFATRCVELNFDVKSLSEILGHATVNITMNRYVHPSMEYKRQNMQRLSELIAVR